MPNSDDVKDLDLQVKKTVISAESFKRGSAFDSAKSFVSIHKTMSSLAEHLRKVVIRVGDLEKSVNNQSRKITSLKNISALQGPQIRGTNIGAKLPGGSVQTVDKNIAAITESVSSIAEILAGRKKLADDTAAYDRKKSEREKRALEESKLEKRFDGLKKTAEKIIAPVKSLLDRILEFFTTIILGRIVFKLIEWFGDKKNADKVRSIIRFLGDHWPKLLALYLVFGNSFGRFALRLSKVVFSGAIKLGAAIARLLAANKIKGAMGAARFLGGGRGKLLANVAGTALALGGTYALTQGLKGEGEENQKAQGYSGGGFAIPKFSGGGFNFGNLFSGLIRGQKGVDKIPAMLSDGEFVMSRGAVAKYGVDTLEAMNAAGGGTNKPKIMSGTTYAAGGGYIGDDISSSLKSKYDAKHGAGAYDKQLAEKKARFAQEDATEEARKKRIASNATAVKNNKPKEKKIDYTSINGIRIPDLKIDPAKISQDTAERNKIIQSGQQRRDAARNARSEYAKILKDQSHPLHEQASFGNLTLDKFKQQYKPASISTGYMPYQSRFAGARDAAFARAKMIGGFMGVKSQDYYKSNTAAREKQLSGLTSQQRLNALSLEGKGPKTGSGRRFLAEQQASSKEFDGRGGMLGGIGRGFTRMFGSAKDRSNVAASDAASSARVKQAGAASIGRYYSSSDGKYYKDYNAAVLAKKQRVKSGVKPPVKPKPRSKADLVGGYGGGAMSSGKGSVSKPKTPNFSATTRGMRSKQETLGLMR